MRWLRSALLWLAKRSKRLQTCMAWCPFCKNELVSCAATMCTEDESGLVTYECGECKATSRWLFDAPVPLLIDGKASAMADAARRAGR